MCAARGRAATAKLYYPLVKCHAPFYSGRGTHQLVLWPVHHLAERAAVVSIAAGLAHLQRNRTVTVPLRYRYITSTLLLHYRYITTTLPLHYRYITATLPLHYRCITATLPLHYR